MAESERRGKGANSLGTTMVQVGAALAVVGGIALVGLALFGGSNNGSSPAADGRESLNISCFVYRDVNRSGSYDLADRPYAALRIEGSGSDGAVTTTSNSGGFANFRMLLDGDGVLVAQPGTYTFEAFPPDGWELSSGDPTQSVEFVELAGAPAGIVATEQCEPYGLIPVLTIAGKIAPADEVAIESDLGSADVETVDGVDFIAPVAPDTWTVSGSSSDSSDERLVDVDDAPVFMSRFTEDRDAYVALPNTVIVDFDDFTTANTITEIPNGYGGVDWANWVSTHRILYGGPGYVNTGTSGEFVAYNSSGHPATISSDEPFDFVGGYFGVAWPEAERHDIVVQAWRGTTLVSTDSFRATTRGPLYFAADYRSITRVEISSAANWQFVLDDLELRTGD